MPLRQTKFKFQLDRSRTSQKKRPPGSKIQKESDDDELSFHSSPTNDGDVVDSSSSDEQELNTSKVPSSKKKNGRKSPQSNSKARAKKQTPQRDYIGDSSIDEAESDEDLPLSQLGKQKTPKISPGTRRGTAAKKPIGARRGRLKKATESDSDYDDQEEDAQSEDSSDELGEGDDEDYRPSRSKRSAAPKKSKKPASKRRGRASKKESSSESDDDFEEKEHQSESSDEKEFALQKSRPTRNNATRKKLKQVSKVSSRSSPRASNTIGDDESSSDEDFSTASKQKQEQGRKLTPSRTSASKASKRINQNVKDDEDSSYVDSKDDGIDDAEHLPMIKKKNKKKASASSDEEYSAGSASVSSEEDETPDFEDDEEELSDSERSAGKAELSNSEEDDGNEESKSKGVNIDGEQIGSAEESSSDEEVVQKPRQRQNTSRHQRDEIRPSQGSLSDSSSEEDIDSRRNKRPSMPICTSIEDAITLAALPRIHVCNVAPDGNSRQCFALETLRLTALKCSNSNTRIELDGTVRKTFLQPPHFRTAMSDELIDQIDSKFGKDALNLEGAYYHRKKVGNFFGNVDDGDHDFVEADEMFDYDDRGTFDNRVNDYFKKQMGKQDIYVCPLCYIEMHRRVNSIDQGVDEKRTWTTDFVHDPMAVLEWLDDSNFSTASTCCFKRVAPLKSHLREDHGVDTRDVQGNDFYLKFRVRVGDGLLQRWLRRKGNGGHSQGAMMSYWFTGYNQSYLHLIDQIGIAERYRTILSSHPTSSDESGGESDDIPHNIAKAEEYMSKPLKFFKSIDDAKEGWETLTAPYRRSNEDIREFLADDDEEVESEEVPHFVSRRHVEQDDEESDQNDFAHILKRKYGEPMSSEQDELSLEEESEGKDSDVRSFNGHYSEVEEEKDDWVLSKQGPFKRRKSDQQKENITRVEVLSSPITKRLKKKHRDANQTPSPPPTASEEKQSDLQRTTSSKKRRIQEESSSEEEEFG